MWVRSSDQIQIRSSGVVRCHTHTVQIGVRLSDHPPSIFNAYDQNTVIFTKYVDGPADSDIVNSEAKIVSDVVAFHERVNVTTDIITEESQ